MIATRCLRSPFSCGGACGLLLALCRVVVVLVVMVLAVVLALRGYPVGAITGPVLVLLAGAVAAADRLTGVPRVGLVSALPAP